MINKTILALLVLVLLGTTALIATGNGYIITSFQRTYLDRKATANINDHKVFEVRQIKTGDKQPLIKAKNYNKIPLTDDFSQYLTKFGSVGFLVLKDGQIVSENYFNGYHARSKTNSFSMAKTITTLLLGMAIEDGHIDGLEQKITDFLPEFLDDPKGKDATIAQLSLMNSGYEWTEHYYSPFSPTVELFYGPNVESFLLEGHFSARPGEFWEYSSASTQLLGIILNRALKQQSAELTISDYLSKKIWQPLQMNDDGLWHTDDNGLELTFCCINTNLRNYAKFGILMLNGGRWNGRQLIPESFVQQMITPVGAPHYGYSTWINQQATPSYYWFSGHLGQYIINIPEHNMVIVRLGETRNSGADFRTVELPLYIKHALKLAELN